MANKFRLKKNISSIDIYTPYNATFVSEVKKLGSKWNDTDRCWTVSSDKLDEVKALIKKFMMKMLILNQKFPSRFLLQRFFINVYQAMIALQY